jgi:hypothetical protein
MSRSVFIYAGILVVALVASWQEYTGDKSKPKVGVVLVDGKKDQLEKMVYKNPDLEVVFQRQEDDHGQYYWVTVTENKKKKENGQDVPYTKITKFKASGVKDGSAEKLLDLVAPTMALRSLDAADSSKMESFGLDKTDTSFSITSAGRTTTLLLGGETYGTKDRYVKEDATGRIYVVDDDVFKPLKFATSRLPERGLYSSKKAEIEGLTLTRGGSSVSWAVRNRDDKDAIYWERKVDGAAPAAPATPEGSPTVNPAATAGGRDDTFSNWFDKLDKLKSTAYVQEADVPTDLAVQFEVTVTPVGKKPEIVQFLKSGDDWYAKGDYVRGLVKLSKSSTQDAGDEVSDILEGRVPPPDAKPAGPKNPHAGPAPSGPPPMLAPGGPPGMGPPGMPRPPGAPPPAPPPRPSP